MIVHSTEGVDLIPSSIALSGTEMELFNAMCRERMLASFLERIKEQYDYDYCFIDCGPSLGLLNINALAASDSVIIPMEPSFKSVKGMKQLMTSIERIRKKINPDLMIDGIVFNKVNKRANNHRNIMAQIREEYDNVSMRTHFAVSFTKGRSNEKDTNRKKSVRDAFNAPFRPFVLASTSIGQEGLDFHNYCRRIVHWNLPSNPIDLEQREGRINRFECLAIRQNLAKRYKFDFEKDIWQELFLKASEKEKDEGCSDLIPYWGLTEKNDMVKIERIVPIYPFSRDEIKYDRLIRILSLYRLTLGQARQEELLENISKMMNLDETEIKDLFINLSPFYKKY